MERPLTPLCLSFHHIIKKREINEIWACFSKRTIFLTCDLNMPRIGGFKKNPSPCRGRLKMQPNEKQLIKILEKTVEEGNEKIKKMLEAEETCFNRTKDGSDFVMLPPNPMFVRVNNLIRAKKVNDLFKMLDEKEEPKNRESEKIRGYMA